MRILAFGDIHFHHTHHFSHIVREGFTIRELEHIDCAKRVLEICDKENVDKIVLLGDVWGPVGDTMSCQTLTAVAEFFKIITEKYDIDVIVGNHDLNSSTNNVNSHKLVAFKGWNRIHIYDSCTINGDFVYMPYCESNEFAQAFINNIENKESKIIFSHLELKGIPLGGDIVTQKGIDLDTLKKFKMVLQGHYHSGRTLAKNIYVAGSTQRISFKDMGIARKNILIYDTETNKMKRESFTCPDWLVFNDDNIEDLLKIDNNNYVKLDITTDVLLTDEIKEKLNQVKDKEIHYNLSRISVNKKITEEVELNKDDTLDVLKYIINKSNNSDLDKEELYEEGIRLINKVS